MRPIRPAWLVARREFRERTASRAFLVWTAVIGLVAAGTVVAGAVLPGRLEPGPAQLGAVPGTSAALLDAVRSSSEQLGIPVDIRPVASRAEGEAAVRSGELDALYVDADTLVFDRKESTSLAAVVNRAVQAESLPRRLGELGLSADQARSLIAPPPVGVALLRPAAPERAGSGARAENGLVAAASVALLYVALAVYGGLVLNGVVEEKTNRVVEVLLGTLHTTDLLAGKVVGIMAAAMLQLFVAVAAAAVALLAVGGVEIPRVAFGVAALSIVWFVLGLTLYNFAYAAMGSTVSRASDAQSASMPVTLLLLIPYLAGLVLVPGDPNSRIVTVLSIFPLSSPMVMPARAALGNPGAWQVGLALVLMLPAIAGMVWLAGRIYRGSILRSGPRVSLLQLIHSRHEL